MKSKMYHNLILYLKIFQISFYCFCITICIDFYIDFCIDFSIV